jgi:uncharacterized membrane protein
LSAAWKRVLERAEEGVAISSKTYRLSYEDLCNGLPCYHCLETIFVIVVVVVVVVVINTSVVVHQ